MEDIKYIIKGDTFNGKAKKSDLESDKKRIRVKTEEGGIKLIVLSLSNRANLTH